MVRARTSECFSLDPQAESIDDSNYLRVKSKRVSDHGLTMRRCTIFILAVLWGMIGHASSSSFSSGLRFTAGDLNDFLLPAEQCVLPLQQSLRSSKSLLPKKSRTKGNESKLPTPTPNSGATASPSSKQSPSKKEVDGATLGNYEQSTNSTSKPSENVTDRDSIIASVSLSDCLSCSGCLTSSEEILMGRHSASLLRNMSADSNVVVVVSLSPQACASIAEAAGLQLEETAGKLASFLRSIGVRYVLSTSVSNTIALHEACEEFEQRWLACQEDRDGRRKSLLPVLCSECPGITVYLEKTQTKPVVRLLSRVKSPQAISSSILKRIRNESPIACRFKWCSLG